VLKGGYDGVVTSHSLITAYRLRELGLPIFHVNSTRFGNEWIQDAEKHSKLVQEIQSMLDRKQLRVLHNNRGDQVYFHQFFKCKDDIYIPSFCESLFRLRTKSVQPMRFLIWDTRQVLLQDKSPFMKELFAMLKGVHGECIDSQAILLAQQKNFLPEGYLDKYTAVIHIPYNISTMSIFQQTRANIPIWIPSKDLLEAILTDPSEPNELSWTVFKPGSEVNGSPLDKARDPAIVKEWVSHADFYYPETMGCVGTFDSVEDLVNKITTTNYQSMIDANEKRQKRVCQSIVLKWEQVVNEVYDR
jgi:hypothetical protein